MKMKLISDCSLLTVKQSGWHRDTRVVVHYVEFWELHVESHRRHEFIQIKLKSYDYFWN